jgi:signal peptidase I
MGKQKSRFREYSEAIIVAIVLALFIRTFVVQAFKIPSGSMIPTLLIGDHILVNKFLYGIRIPLADKKILAFSQPKRGDVVVFVYPLDESKDFIKRVIGVEGDTILIKGKDVYINGERYADTHAHYIDNNPGEGSVYRKDFGPFTVPKDSLFVMGDNRDRSYDGRYWNKFVTLDQVIGKAFLIYWSNGSLYPRAIWNVPMKVADAVLYNRWSRIGNLIH